MEQLIGAMRNEKVSTGVFGILLTITWLAYTWAGEQHKDLSDSHISRVEYKQDQDKMIAQVGSLTTLMTEHVEDMQIVNASQLIRDKELALQVCQATGRPQSEIEALEEQITEAKLYRKCLIEQQPNCKHLKPSE